MYQLKQIIKFIIMDLQKQGSMGFENNSVSTKSFGLKDKVGYLCGDLGNDFTFIFASMYLMIFYTQKKIPLKIQI